MNNENLHYISNSDVTVGVLVKRGGTIVYLSKNKSPNILKSNPQLWAQSIDVNESTDFVPLNGHTIWVGPQSEWWCQQNVNEQRKQEKSGWPPDPIITLGEYTVVSQTEWGIKLQSPESKISGIVIEKEIAVNPDGSVFIQITMINASNEVKSWDIWHNTRIPGFSKVYVPTTEKNTKVVPVLNQNSTEMPYGFIDGYFTYKPEMPPKNFSERSSKAFIYPELPNIFAFSNSHMLSISFEKHEKKQIHPEQGLVEIYNHTENSMEQALLELEYHSPYFTMKPNDVQQAWEVWTIEEYSGENTDKKHIQFIKSIL